jgi:hypothetical protein
MSLQLVFIAIDDILSALITLEGDLTDLIKDKIK